MKAPTSGDGEGLIGHLPRYRRVTFDPRHANAFPFFARAPAAVLRCDVVEFTALTDRMVKRGIAGAERLADILGEAINRMAEIAWAQGGDLVNWDGDAGTFVWFAGEALTLSDAAMLAVQAAQDIHREAANWRFDGDPVQFRSAVACGTLIQYEIGGDRQEWHSALGGECLTDVIAAERAGAPGTIALSPAALALVGERCRTAVEDGVARVLSVNLPATPPNAPPLSGDVPDNVLRKLVPPIVRAERFATKWSGEFRVVTVAYLRLRHPDYALPEDTIATLQDAAQRVQHTLARYEGQLYKTVAEDDGITFIVLFGLPPWPHEDDAARAVKGALTLHRQWGALGLTSSTGVATGRVFCGTFQTTTDRAVLALVGPIMNLAARLMQLNAGVLCDEETCRGGRHSARIAARRMTPRVVKGKPEPITVFAAYEVGGSFEPQRAGTEAAMIGRERELAALTDSLARARAGAGDVVVIEGDAGIGKSTLLHRVVAEAGAAGMIVLAGAGDSTDSTSPYLAWRPAFLDLLAMSDLTFPGLGARSSAAEAEPVDGDQAPIIRLGAFARSTPLLEDMLGLAAVDNGDTALLRGQARATALARLLQDLLVAAAKVARLVVIVEDLHWLDPTSLKLFADLAASRPPFLLIGASRGPDANAAVRRTLAGAPEVRWLRPEPMTALETGSLLARTIGARQADVDLATLFRDRTGGNPLFVEELARMALANQLLFVDAAVQARSSVASAKGRLDDIVERQGLPGTIEAVILRRLDKLDAQDASVLKAASVVGQSFDRTLCAVGAPALTRAEVDRSLAALSGMEIVGPSGRDPDKFEFRHEVLHDVVYNAMSFAERREIHNRVGGWIEAHPHADDVSAPLARHFLLAERRDKAIRYLTAAGEAALRRYANAEAAELLGRALELAEAPARAATDGGSSEAERARISLRLGRALLGLSSYADCRAHNEAGLRLAGFVAPSDAPGVALALIWQSAKLIRYRLRSARREAPEAEKIRLREAVLAYEALAESYFFSGDALRTLHAALSTLNLAERLGPSAELARGCATASGIMGFVRLRSTSAHYSARALQILANLDDPAAETWVLTLLGLSKRSAGQWELSSRFFAKVVASAVRIGDRRRWRDGVEGAAVNHACRGNWREAVAGLNEMLESARRDNDQRYLLVARRELAYCNLQLGDLDAVEDSLVWIKGELARGVATEELPSRLDAHALAATVALQRGDYAQAAKEADAALKTFGVSAGRSNVTNTYWALSLTARAFANLWAASRREGGGDPTLLKSMAAACAALSSQTWSFPIAAPSADIARGHLAHLRGRAGTAARCWRRAAASARRLDLTYEAFLARRALGEASGPGLRDSGLPYMAIGEPAYAGIARSHV